MIVYYDSGRYAIFRKYFIASGVKCIPLWRNQLLRIGYWVTRAHLPKKMVFNVPEPAASDDKIIVFDTHVTPAYLYWLCKLYPDKRIILWYWNPVNEKRTFDFFPRRVEIWSYSPSDCEKYGFRYNSQFYFDCIAGKQSENIGKVHTQPTVCFIGREKGRKESVLKIRDSLAQSGIATDCHFMIDGVLKKRSREPLLPYSRVVDLIRGSDAILDYTLQENAGLSLRPMEALFWGKKLITNQKSIRQYDFYRKENIYILGEETRGIKEFLSTSSVKVESDIRDYYLLSSWLKRFDEPEEKKR